LGWSHVSGQQWCSYLPSVSQLISELDAEAANTGCRHCHRRHKELSSLRHCSEMVKKNCLIWYNPVCCLWTNGRQWFCCLVEMGMLAQLGHPPPCRALLFYGSWGTLLWVDVTGPSSFRGQDWWMPQEL
jgi:hypothetical protein